MREVSSKNWVTWLNCSNLALNITQKYLVHWSYLLYIVFLSLENILKIEKGNYQVVSWCKYRIRSKVDKEGCCPVMLHQCNLRIILLLLFIAKGEVDKLKTVVGFYTGKLISLAMETCIYVIPGWDYDLVFLCGSACLGVLALWSFFLVGDFFWCFFSCFVMLWFFGWGVFSLKPSCLAGSNNC